MSPATASRRRAIRKLLDETPVTSQARLVELLDAEGFPVTQATVSRDLDALGATKLRAEDGTIHYTITNGGLRPTEAESRLARAVNDFVDQIAVSGNLAVIHTPPGAAHLVAGAIDGAPIDGVLGTVAGDDTLLVIASEDIGGAGVAALIEDIGARR